MEYFAILQYTVDRQLLQILISYHTKVLKQFKQYIILSF